MMRKHIHNIKTLGPKTALLFTKLHDQDRLVFDLTTAAQLMQVDHTHASGILHAAVKRGLVTPLRRGLYNLVPFEMGSVSFHLENRYAIVGESMGDKPYYLSHASALDLHHLATQPSFDVYVSTTHRLATRNLGGATVHFVTTKSSRFFGCAPHDLGKGQKVTVSDLERTLVDGLALPEYCGGIVEVAKAIFMAKSRFDADKLIGYARRMDRDAILRRLGFLLETLGMANAALLDSIKAGLPAGAVKLDPDLPLEGPHHAKWGLRLNVSADEILKAVSH